MILERRERIVAVRGRERRRDSERRRDWLTEDRGGLSDLQHSCPVACPSSLLQTQHTAGSEGTRLLCGREEGNARVFVWMVVVRLRPPGLSLSDFFLKSYSSQASIRKSGNFPLHNPTLCVCVGVCVCGWVGVGEDS